jgi:hypothetical protein
LDEGKLPMITRTIVWGTILAATLGGSLSSRAAEPTPIAPEQFDRLHRMIRVQPEEQRFWRIPWKLRVTEARAQAAAEGKPILVWAGAGGAPIGVC